MNPQSLIYRKRADAENVFDELREGYSRLCRWLDASAPQLGKPPARLPVFSPLKPQFLFSTAEIRLKEECYEEYCCEVFYGS